MKKTLYLECNSGISGDMTVGALLDLGADRKVLEDALASLGVDGYHLHFGTTEKCGIKAYDFDVHLEYEEHVHEHCHDHDHEHHHHAHDDECGCGHDHDHEHHHHDHDDECGCGCHDHHHDHEGHHHADDVFTSWGLENVGVMKKEDLQKILDDLAYGDKYGEVLRAKGMVPSEEKGVWLHFDMVQEQAEIREGAPDFTGKVCVIGAELDEEGLKAAFNA